MGTQRIQQYLFAVALLSICAVVYNIIRTSTIQIAPEVKKLHVVNSHERNLYIHVTKFGEGMSSWRRGLLELVSLAKALNATLVEPCIKEGRLRSCTLEHNSKLGDLYELNKMKEFHPYIISHSQFQKKLVSMKETNHTNTAVVKACHTVHKYTHWCDKGIPNCYGRNFGRKSCARLLQKVVTISKTTQTTIFEIQRYRKEGWGRATLNGNRIVNNPETLERIATKYLQFNPSIYDFVDSFLLESGVTENQYSVIHWRGEIHTLDYLTCAKHILTARDIMMRDQKNNMATTTMRKSGNNSIQKNASPASFFLMSSLNRNKSLVWKKKSAGSEAQEALTLLLDDNGFLKIDSFLAQEKNHSHFATDQAFLAAIDLVLAQKANDFATCDTSCWSWDICSKCGFRGSFAWLAISMRENSNKKSRHCWPEKKWYN